MSKNSLAQLVGMVLVGLVLLGWAVTRVRAMSEVRPDTLWFLLGGTLVIGSSIGAALLTILNWVADRRAGDRRG